MAESEEEKDRNDRHTISQRIVVKYYFRGGSENLLDQKKDMGCENFREVKDLVLTEQAEGLGRQIFRGSKF